MKSRVFTECDVCGKTAEIAISGETLGNICIHCVHDKESVSMFHVMTDGIYITVVVTKVIKEYKDLGYVCVARFDNWSEANKHADKLAKEADNNEYTYDDFNYQVEYEKLKENLGRKEMLIHKLHGTLIFARTQVNDKYIDSLIEETLDYYHETMNKKGEK